jgi:hypothetical protein
MRGRRARYQQVAERMFVQHVSQAGMDSIHVLRLLLADPDEKQKIILELH